MTSRGRRLLLAVLLGGMLIVLALLTPLAHHLGVVSAWIDLHQTEARFTFILIYVVAAVLALPASPLTLAAGVLFGLPLGSGLVFVGAIAGGALAFLSGRFIAHDWVARRFADSPRYRALAIATRSKGFLIVLLARLSPLIPFNVLNYGLSVTHVRFNHYVLATICGMPPVIVLYVYLGTLARSLTELAASSGSHPMTARFVVGGLLATLAVGALIARVATRALNAELEQAQTRPIEP